MTTTTNAGGVEVRSTSLSSASSFNISKFRESIGTVARPNNWYAEIFFGAGTLSLLGLSANVLMPNFSFRCERTTMPGKTVNTVDDVGVGPTLKIAQDMSYTDLDMTILCSTDMQERWVFESWMNVIVLRRGLGGAGLISYYEDYAEGNVLELNHLDDFGNIIMQYTLYDVYPIQISAMNLNWEENNTYQRFDVTLNYRDSICKVPNDSRLGPLDDGGGNIRGGYLDNATDSGAGNVSTDGSDDAVGGAFPLYDDDGNRMPEAG